VPAGFGWAAGRSTSADPLFAYQLSRISFRSDSFVMTAVKPASIRLFFFYGGLCRKVLLRRALFSGFVVKQHCTVSGVPDGNRCGSLKRHSLRFLPSRPILGQPRSGVPGFCQVLATALKVPARRRRDTSVAVVAGSQLDTPGCCGATLGCRKPSASRTLAARLSVGCAVERV
jgi:hypothetical protein